MGCCQSQTPKADNTSCSSTGGCGCGPASATQSEATVDKRPLSANEIAGLLAQLPGWHYDADDNQLYASIIFPDFARAWSFMSLVALAAEQLNHHPSWHNVYNRLHVQLNTHDLGAVSNLDLTLAYYMHHHLAGYHGEYEAV